MRWLNVKAASPLHLSWTSRHCHQSPWTSLHFLLCNIVFVFVYWYLYLCICICIWSRLTFVLVHFWWKSIPEIKAGFAWILRVGTGGGEPNSRTERPKVFPRVANRRFLSCDLRKFAFEGIADQKIALTVLVIFGLRTQKWAKFNGSVTP